MHFFVSDGKTSFVNTFFLGSLSLLLPIVRSARIHTHGAWIARDVPVVTHSWAGQLRASLSALSGTWLRVDLGIIPCEAPLSYDGDFILRL